MSANGEAAVVDEPALEEGATGRAEGLKHRGVGADAIVRGGAEGRPPEGEDVGIPMSARMAKPQWSMNPRSRKCD